MLLLLVLSFALSGVHCMDEGTKRYVELSMNWTIALKDWKEASEQEIHDLSKNVLTYEDNPPRLARIYEKFLDGKSDAFRKFVQEHIIEERLVHRVEQRLQKILGYYLTKKHIEEFRRILNQQALAKKTNKETVEAIKKELTMELSEEKAGKAVDMVVKDLEILYRIHGDVVGNVDQQLAYLAKTEL